MNKTVHLSQYYLAAVRQSVGTSVVDLAKSVVDLGKGTPRPTRMTNDRNNGLPNHFSGSTGSVHVSIISHE